MALVECPHCGADEELAGEQVDGAITLTCLACGARWDRDTEPVCGVCGSTDVQGIPAATLEEHGRANVRSPSGIRLAYYCWDCRSKDVTSTHPDRGPHPPPGSSTRDLRALRRR